MVRQIPTKLLCPTPARMEKQILRDAFRSLIPPETYNRRKEAFSDGVNVGVPWFKRDDEEAWYNMCFDKIYPRRRIFPYKWMPKWSPETNDPSATTLSNYRNPGS